MIIGKSRGIAAFWENGFVMMRATTLMVLNAVALVHSVVDLQLSAKAPSSKTIVLCVHVDCTVVVVAVVQFRRKHKNLNRQ